MIGIYNYLYENYNVIDYVMNEKIYTIYDITERGKVCGKEIIFADYRKSCWGCFNVSTAVMIRFFTPWRA